MTAGNLNAKATNSHRPLHLAIFRLPKPRGKFQGNRQCFERMLLLVGQNSDPSNATMPKQPDQQMQNCGNKVLTLFRGVIPRAITQALPLAHERNTRPNKRPSPRTDPRVDSHSRCRGNLLVRRGHAGPHVAPPHLSASRVQSYSLFLPSGRKDPSSASASTRTTASPSGKPGIPRYIGAA